MYVHGIRSIGFMCMVLGVGIDGSAPRALTLCSRVGAHFLDKTPEWNIFGVWGLGIGVWGS
jgi:ribose/xylose/arabinose/galactoside ABC-type transport system permease subunit